MDVIGFIILLSIGVLLCICVSYLSFVDYVSLLFIIFPIQNPKDYNQHKVFVKSTQYKKHKQKWRCLFCLNIFIYAFIYVLISWGIQNIVYGFLLGLFGAAIGMGIMGNVELKNRKELQNQFKKNNNSLEKTDCG